MALSVSPGAMHWVVSSYRSYSGIKTTSIGTASMAWFVDTIVWKSWFGLVRVEKRNVRKVLIYLLREIQYAHIVGYLVYLYTGIYAVLHTGIYTNTIISQEATSAGADGDNHFREMRKQFPRERRCFFYNVCLSFDQK